MMALSDIPALHVQVRFGKDIPLQQQGPALLEFERTLRKLCPGLWIEVFKELKGDDSKLRTMMTAAERKAL